MRILVIEDEPRILSFLVRGLEAEGFTVESAMHGVAAVERARGMHPDLVVLDLLLPGVDGLSVLRELKQERPELPVVILSARGDLPTKLRGFELGASDYVAKPFALAELIARVRAQLRQSTWPGDANVVHAGALVLDLARRQAQLGALVTDLSDREFKLLYGFRVWRVGATLWTLSVVFASTGALILLDVQGGSQLAGELFEVPLMSAMFLAMVWHARRRQQAMRVVERLADERASLLERQERFLHDASHELRTPVTIARGHLEVLQRLRGGAPEVDVALDELHRIERIVERLLLLAKADQPDFLAACDIDVEQF